MHLLQQYLYGEYDEKGYLTIGKTKLSKMANIDPKTLNRCLNELETYGFIRLIPGGFGASILIELLDL